MSLCVVFLIITGLSICHSQDVGGLTDSELDMVVEFVKSHETFQQMSSTNSVGTRVVGYSFQMDSDGGLIFNGLFSGTPDFVRVRDGLDSITEQQATQLLKEDLRNIVQALDAEFGSFASYSFDVKKGLVDAEFSNILSDELRSYLIAAPRWQRVCFAIITSTEGDDTRRFDDCRSICPVPTPFIRDNAMYDACTTEQVMFPYGVDFNDEIGPVNDDGSSGRIDLLTFFPFYDELHESLFVNTNGLISFDEEEATYTSQPFPLTSDQGSGGSSTDTTVDEDTPLIAPFWADVDTTKGGTIYYRQMTRLDDRSLADAIDDIVNEHVMYSGDEFQLIWYLVATWDQVAYYGRPTFPDTRDITNTFQAILVTDGIQSYTIFNYGDIQWTTGIASDGDNYGLGGTPAQVGCNAGDEFRHHDVPESQTDAIVNIDETSNVGQPGRYFFKISEENVVSYDCNDFDSGSILTYPSFGSMLGGARIFIQGTCFDNQDIVMCKFIDDETGPEVACQYENERAVSCVVPWLLRIGRVPVFLSKDGGMTYGFQGIYTAVSVDEVTEDVAPKARLEYDDDLQRYTVMWRADALQGHFFDIDIVLYDDYNPTNLEIVNIANDRQLETAEENYEYLVPVNFEVVTSKLVGVVRVMQGDEEPGGNNDFALYIWSDPFDVSIFYKYKLDLPKWCSSWPNLYGAFTSDGELRCPCNLQTALVDRGRFESSPRCSNTVQDSCSDDVDIVHCVRSSSPSSNGEGLECCYNLNGDLANIADNLYAGYIHQYHYLGREPFDRTGTAPYFSHYTSDVLPYLRCCSTRSDCDRYFIPYRPSQDCIGYQPPRPARMNGDPHILTLDGLAYTFNGHGEYSLMDALGGLFAMQGRTEPIKNGTTTIDATRFTAIAAKFNNDTMVHVALNQVRGLVAYMTEDYVWSRINFDGNPIWSGTGITIFYTKATNETSVSITVAYDFGLSFVVEANNDLMSIIVYGPEMLRGNTSGLLGNWNDDVTDDLRTPDGDIIPSNSTLRDIHYDFGEKWRVDPEDSILYYIPGTDYSTYYNPDFVPWFEPPDNFDQEEVKKLCGDNIECIFDYQVTGNVEIAKVTKDIVEFVEEIKEDVKPVVVCGFISTPQNGSKTGTTYTEGSILIFSCETGFKLTGESRIICTTEGVWSDLTPVCVDQCEYVEAPQNGAKEFKGQTLYFTCEDGYTLNGESSITCMRGMVSDSVPTCEEDFPIMYVIIGVTATAAGLFLIFISILCCWCFCCRRSSRRSQAGKHQETSFVKEHGDTGLVDNPTYDGGISNPAYERRLF